MEMIKLKPIADEDVPEKAKPIGTQTAGNFQDQNYQYHCGHCDKVLLSRSEQTAVNNGTIFECTHCHNFSIFEK